VSKSKKNAGKTAPSNVPIQELMGCGICFEEKYSHIGKLDCCKHAYCFDCIFKWSESSNTCPQCKRRISKISKINSESGKTESTKKIKKRDFSDDRASAAAFGPFGLIGMGVGGPDIFHHLINSGTHNHAGFLFHYLSHIFPTDEDDDDDYQEEHDMDCDEDNHSGYSESENSLSYHFCQHCNPMLGCLHEEDDDDDDDVEFHDGKGTRSNPIEID